MAQKPEKRPSAQENQRKKDNAPMNRAMTFFIAGCLAEIYLLVVRRYYINGTLEQVVAWDNYIQVLALVGLGILAVGIVASLLLRKDTGWKRGAAWSVLGAGAYVAVASQAVKMLYVTALNPLMMVVPAVMLLGILWNLYDRECAYALTILSMTTLLLWACRKGIGTAVWSSRVRIVGVIYLVLVVLVTLAAKKVEQKKGMLGKLRVLPVQADILPIYVACGISLVSVALALLNATIAYYTMWVAAICIFALAIYYTVRQL